MKRRGNLLLYLCLGILFALSATSIALASFDTFDVMWHDTEYARPPFRLGDANWGAVALQPEADAAGMKLGDAVLAVNGRAIDGFVVYYAMLRGARAGDRLNVRVQSPGTTTVRDLTIEMRPYRDPATPAPGVDDYVRLGLQVVVLPVACTALGCWVAAVRIRDRSAWLVLLVLLSFPAYVSAPGFALAGPIGPPLAAFGAFRSQVLPLAIMLFGIAFPTRLTLDRRLPWLKWPIAGYLLLVVTLVSIDVALWMHHLYWSRRLMQAPIQLLTGVEGDFGGFVSMLAMLVGAGALGWKALTATNPDARRRLILLFFGAAPGIAALLIILIAIRLDYPIPTWSVLPLIAMMLTFPLAMAYVIVVHRAMDVRVVIRQGLQYMLARGGIRAMQIALFAIISIAAAAYLSRGVGPGRVALVVGALVTIVAISRRFADRLRGWVDRRFFREAYEADAILSDLAQRVRTIVETGPLLETVGTRIAESLHVQTIVILLEQDNAFRPAYARGWPALPTVELRAHGASVERLRAHHHVVVDLENAPSWTQNADEDERSALQHLKSELLLPLALNQKLLGIMSLGPKQSEEPYSPTDIRLLDSVATHTGLALENGRLTETIKKEVAAREKQKREMEIAHEVQQRLFPQDYPAVDGIDYAGSCRPALGVGGDYYDFIHRSKSLGIAIGDVSGKGVPAALLMATLRAFLRGQTLQPHADLGEVMANLNTLVFESSASNRYATFFYAELDCASRTLTYVNAGHNAPMIFRESDGGATVLRLDCGGPVIGLMEDCSYQQARVTLEPGDLLVAYTDGISEAMNADDEEWGEDRLMDAVRASRDAPAGSLIATILQAADAFVAGAPQHDDMTTLIVRIQ